MIELSNIDYKAWRSASNELKAALQSWSITRELMWGDGVDKPAPTERGQRLREAWLRLGEILNKT